MALGLQLFEGALHRFRLVAMGDHHGIVLDDDDEVLDADQHRQRAGGLDIIVTAVDQGDLAARRIAGRVLGRGGMDARPIADIRPAEGGRHDAGPFRVRSISA